MPRPRLSRLEPHATLLALTVVAVLVPVGSASAVTRYAANYRFVGGNTGAAPCTDAARPCLLTVALGAAQADDEVVMSPGTYRKPGFVIETAQQPPYDQPLVVPDRVTLRGSDPTKLPVIVVVPSSQAAAGVSVGSRAVIRDVAISGKAKANTLITYSLQLGGLATAEGVRIQTAAAVNAIQIGVSMGNGSVLRNSVSIGTGSETGGRITAASATSKDQTATVRNSTLISLTPEGNGFSSGTSSGVNTVAITNSILRGPGADLRVRSGLSGGQSVANVDHSNWLTQDVSAAGGATAVLNHTGGNQNGPTAVEPKFVDPAIGDYRQLADSPTINAGVVDVNNGPLAFGGKPRHVGVTTDIGADEFDPAKNPITIPLPPLPDPTSTTPDPVAPGETPDPTGSAPTGGLVGQSDAVSPVLSGLKLGAKFKRSKGTTVRFTLTEPAKVTLAFAQPKPGRSAASGKCVKQTTKNRKRAKCTIANLRGTLTVTGKAGANTLSFKGKVAGKKAPLAYGGYSLTATATDAAGNVAKPSTKKFTLTR